MKQGYLSNKEEDFSSEWIGENLLVKQSEQGTSWLDSLRFDTFSRYNKAIEKAGLSADDAKRHESGSGVDQRGNRARLYAGQTV